MLYRYAYTHNKGADQPAHPYLAMISSFIVNFLKCIIHLLGIAKSARLACLCGYIDWFESKLVKDGTNTVHTNNRYLLLFFFDLSG